MPKCERGAGTTPKRGRGTEPPYGAPRVYSYIRFSTPEQALGDSERRQLEQAKAYAAQQGLPFDECLRMTDRGLSGYHGDHRRKGALGAFLESTRRGNVPAGSTLVVENLDRLSREDFLHAIDLVTGLIEAGVAIHTCRPEMTYDRDSLNGGAVYQLIGQMQLAHDESEKKSERLSAAWAYKRKQAVENRVPFTGQAPAWLTVAGRPPDQRYEVIPEAVETIRRIFDLRLQGIGKGRLVKLLNEQSAWTPPKRKRQRTNGWQESYIVKILSNPAVVGEFQPMTGRGTERKPIGDPVPDYYPAIVDKGTFHAAQKLLQGNRGTGGPTGKASNVLRSLVKCAYCGGSMVFISNGKPPKGAGYLVCDSGRRGLRCKARTVRYDEAEVTILGNCRGLRPEQVLPAPDEQTRLCEALRRQLNGIDGELADIGTRRENLADQIERTKNPAMRDRYEDRIRKLDKQEADLKPQRLDLQQRLREAQSSFDSFAKWQEGLEGLRAALTVGNVELRLRLRGVRHFSLARC